jgi:hypothetical protein
MTLQLLPDFLLYEENLVFFLSVQKREARNNGAKGEDGREGREGREGERKKDGKAERGRDK